ncbi:hypothetical protein ACP275_02G078900 [Erythranthe tilingii]
MALFKLVLLLTLLLLGLDSSMSAANNGVSHPLPQNHLESGGDTKVGQCRNLSDCLCPKRCKKKFCSAGQCYCNHIIVGSCSGETDCLCPRRFQNKFCSLGDCFCSDC